MAKSTTIVQHPSFDGSSIFFIARIIVFFKDISQRDHSSNSRYLLVCDNKSYLNRSPPLKRVASPIHNIIPITIIIPIIILNFFSATIVFFP